MSELEVQDHSSDYYPKRYSGWGHRYHADMIHKLCQEMRGQILDVGCGTGIIHDLFPGHDIVGIDISRGMLQHHSGTAFYGSAEEINYPDGKFDFVVCRSLLHHLPHPEKGLSEMYRVLKPGGKVVMWETNKGLLAQAIRKITQHGDRFSDFHHAFSNLPAIVRKYFTIDEVAYQGFVAYPAFGFPDIIDLARWIPFKGLVYPVTQALDLVLGRIPLIRRLSFAVAIKAHKV